MAFTTETRRHGENQNLHKTFVRTTFLTMPPQLGYSAIPRLYW
jgi:hypothetical protein